MMEEARIFRDQTTPAAQLSSAEVSNNPGKLREVANAVDKLAKVLEASRYRWGEHSDEIEKVKATLGIEA